MHISMSKFKGFFKVKDFFLCLLKIFVVVVAFFVFKLDCIKLMHQNLEILVYRVA